MIPSRRLLVNKAAFGVKVLERQMSRLAAPCALEALDKVQEKDFKSAYFFIDMTAGECYV